MSGPLVDLSDTQNVINGLLKILQDRKAARQVLDETLTNPKEPTSYPEVVILVAHTLLGNVDSFMELEKFVNAVEKMSQKAVRIGVIATAVEALQEGNIARFAQDVHLLMETLYTNELAEEDEDLQEFLRKNNFTVVIAHRGRILPFSGQKLQTLETEGWEPLGG